MSDSNKLDRFGRYLILDHLVDGGMAKISRARFLSEDAEKIVAIKMIQQQYSKDPQFKKMFMDEIKVTFGLIHPNIAQTYDYGILSDQLYTAMEYVDGKNLKQFLDRLREIKCLFPVEVSVFITSQVCQGLSYAHNFTDKLTGKPLKIIHRDISPHNIMITYDGAVKVIDFGIAKAETNSEETKAGTIKGKLAYLAPEYLDGVELDERYDQFAVGVTLWELLCARRLFQANNELATLKKIQICKIPAPSSINKKVPKELDDIILQSLSKDRTKRFKNMDQFNRALVKFLYSKFPDFNATDLQGFAQQLFKEEIKKDREKFFDFGKIDIRPYLLDLKAELEGRAPTKKSDPISSNNGATKDEDSEENKVRTRQIIDLGFDESGVIKSDDKNNAELLTLDLHGSAKSGNSNAKNTAKSTVATTISKMPVSTDKKQSKSATGKINVANATRRINVKQGATRDDRKEESKDQFQKVPAVKDGKTKSIFRKIVGFAALCGAIIFFTDGKIQTLWDGTEPLTRQPSAVPSVKKEKTSNKENVVKDKTANHGVRQIFLLNSNPYQKFYLDNVEIKLKDLTFELPLKKDATLRVEQEGRVPIFVDIKGSENIKDQISIPNAQVGTFGQLTTSMNYPEGSQLIFEIQNHNVIWSLPFREMKLPIGQYKGRVKLGIDQATQDVSFEIMENTETKLTK